MGDSPSAQKNPSEEWWHIYISICKHNDHQENGTLTSCSKVLIQMDWKANKKLDYELEEKGKLTKSISLVIVFSPSHSTSCNITTSCQVKRSFHYFWEEETHVKFISFCLIRKEGQAIPNLPTAHHQRKNEIHACQQRSKKRVKYNTYLLIHSIPTIFAARLKKKTNIYISITTRIKSIGQIKYIPPAPFHPHVRLNIHDRISDKICTGINI